MWDTPEGERKLAGAERRAFVISLLNLLETVSSAGEWYEFDASILNQIEVEDRPYVILLVAEALLGESPAPEERAWNAAIVWEIFEEMKSRIEAGIEYEEIEESGDKWPFYMRRAVLDTAKGIPAEDRPRLPRLKSTDMEEWSGLVDFLVHDVLHDIDFLKYEHFADIHPERLDLIKKEVGIEDNYFSDIPPHIDEAAKIRLRSFNDALVRESNQWYKNFEKTGKLTE